LPDCCDPVACQAIQRKLFGQGVGADHGLGFAIVAAK
jgi:hypothetical protein